MADDGELTHLVALGEHLVGAVVDLHPLLSVDAAAELPLARIGGGTHRGGLDGVGVDPLAVIVQLEGEREVLVGGDRGGQVGRGETVHDGRQLLSGHGLDIARHRHVHQTVHLHCVSATARHLRCSMGITMALKSSPAAVTESG